MSAQVHPTAIVDPGARLGDGVRVGAYSIIDAEVEIGDGTVIAEHVVIRGPTRIGRDNRIFQFASIGEISQDMTARPGDGTRTEIGDRNTIREYVTINRGTRKDQGVTRVGSDNWIMAYVHIAHDCRVGNHTIFANNASLAGHVQVDDWAILGGFTLVHQFCRIGRHAFTAYSSGLSGDVPPFVTVQGNPARPRAINAEGLRRRGFSPEQIRRIRDAYKLIYRSGLTLEQVCERLESQAADCEHIRAMLEFLRSARRPLQRG